MNKHFEQEYSEKNTGDLMREADQTILSAAIVRDSNELLEDITDNGWNADVLSDINEAIRLLQMARQECQ